MTETLPPDHEFAVDDDRRAKLLAIFLAFDAPVRPSPFLLGDVSPGHEATAYRFWIEIEDALMARWIEAHPGTRPCAWWWWRAPEPLRQRLGGAGEASSCGFIPYSPRRAPGVSVRSPVMKTVTRELPDYQASWCGLPLSFAEADPLDPPTFESEAAYLKRHRLLPAAEARRLGPDAFEAVEVLRA